MEELVALFAPHCDDKSSLEKLDRLLGDPRLWRDGHDLFRRIRDKTLAAEQQGNGALAAQYLFEEIVAKVLYNLSGAPAPFDPDTPYWVVPNALALARALELDVAQVLAIVGR